ncbi:Hypothetical protein CINCED_3A006075 [Cinara cedri]|uniref:Reduced folate carrier,Major facilitator superfamily domain n=1 Tax=Cinara cedri TaxID=506608 RepID=A0A5E4NCU8_9HEMI|nr:Hypothetical protein CINCED_3A006075 [Cinara cedri]
MISNTINYFYSSICVYVLVSLYTGFTSIATTSYRASSTMSWITISFCLGIYGVLKEFRPSESYVVPYLLGPRMNFTEEQVNNEILPIGIYASMISMIFVALTTDWLRYKIVMVIQALCGVGVYALLSLCTSFTSIVVVEILYGIFDATEVAYSTYIYSVVNVKYYQKVTSYTRAAFLIGRFFSGFLAQIFISTKLVDTYQLNFLTLGSLMAATIWALVLPSIKNNKLTSENYNMKVTSPKTVTQNVHEHDVSMEKNIENKHITWKYIRSMCNEYTNMYVLKWSFWVITSTCCFQQVTNYIQSLWESLSCNDCPHSVCKSTSEWNGAVDAVYTIISNFEII